MVASRLVFLIGILLKCFIGTCNSVKERLPIVLLTQGNYPKVSNKYCLYLIINALLFQSILSAVVLFTSHRSWFNDDLILN